MKRISQYKNHTAALKRLEEMMLTDPAPNSPDEGELNSLAKLIEQFEKDFIFIPKPTATEVLQFRVEQSQ